MHTVIGRPMSPFHSTITLPAPGHRMRVGLMLTLFTVFCFANATPRINAAVLVRDTPETVTGPCLDARNAADTPGTPIDNYDCNATFSQQWNFEGFQIQGLGTTYSSGANCVWATGGNGYWRG